MTRSIHHMALSVEGALRNYPTDKAFIKAFKGSVTDNEGKPIHPLKFRDELWKLHGQGVKVIPMGDCDAFDPVTGCPGHPIEDDAPTLPLSGVVAHG